MNENQVSRTALLMTYLRGYHAMNVTPKIFDDFLAYSFLTKDTQAIIEQQFMPNVQLVESIDPTLATSCPDQATALAKKMQTIVGPPISLSRSRYTEDNLEKAVKKGVQQYVILGAGMDTFAFRCPEIVKRLQVFEIDHPATQDFKCRRLAELGWEHPEQLHFVPIDFTQESLVTALKRSTYDPQYLSFFSWLGVTYYLPRDAVFDTLRVITDVAPRGSTVIFDYLDNDALVLEKAVKRVQVWQENVRRLGEPLITGFNPSTLAEDLKRIGLRLHENLNPSDIQELYFQGRTDGYHACEHVHFAWALVE